MWVSVSGLIHGAIAVLVCFVTAIGATPAADLLDLYERAREYDPLFLVARDEQLISDEIVKESLGGIKPLVTADVDASWIYQNIRQSESILFTVGTSNFFDDRLSISLVQPVYSLAILSRIPQARAEARRSKALLAAAEQDLMFRIAQAHFDVLAAAENLDLAGTERIAIWQQLQQTEERLGAGLAPITDLHDSRARFALAQATEADAEDLLEDSLQALAEIVGEIPSELATLSETVPLVEPDEPDVEAWVRAALFQNPRVKASEATIEIAEQEMRRQRSGRRPTVDAVASIVRANNGGTVFGGGNEINTGDIALRVNIPIYDGGRTSARTRSAAIERRIAVHNLERERRRVQRETRNAFQGVMSGITRVEALAKSDFSYAAALAHKEEGMRSGLNTGLDVLDARRDLFRVKRDLTQARYVYLLNTLRLKQSTGILSAADLRQISAYLQ